MLQLLLTVRAASHSLSATWQVLQDRQALMRMTRSFGAALVAACAWTPAVRLRPQWQVLE